MADGMVYEKLTIAKGCVIEGIIGDSSDSDIEEVTPVDPSPKVSQRYYSLTYPYATNVQVLILLSDKFIKFCLLPVHDSSCFVARLLVFIVATIPIILSGTVL